MKATFSKQEIMPMTQFKNLCHWSKEPEMALKVKVNLSRFLDLQSNHTNSSPFTHYRAKRISWHLKSHAFLPQQLILLIRLEDNNMTCQFKILLYLRCTHVTLFRTMCQFQR